MRRRCSFAALLPALLLAAPALAQTSVTVLPGQMVTVTLDPARDDGAMTVTGPEAITPSAFETETGVKLSRGDYPDATGANLIPMKASDAANPGPVKRGVLRIRFTRIAGYDHVLLLIENGYDRGLIYRATIHQGGKATPTDVCLVIPGKRGVEHWPYPIEALELSAMKLVPWKDGDYLPCL